MSHSPKTAVALFSGGLDSMLACRMMAEQKIRVVALNFDIGFGVSDTKRAWLEQAAKEARAELHIVDIAEQFVGEVLFSPEHGYGSAFNPCIDCHTNMFRHAESYRQKIGADFLISGEVLGERPFSQNRQALHIVAKNSQVKELVLRPLSAKLLDPTLPEIEGWVDRDRLEAISGRSRKRQLELVELFGIKAYESPAGGCLYTDPGFATRIREATTYAQPNTEEIKLFKLGRHMRLPEGAKLIIGRNADENDAIMDSRHSRYHLIEMPDDMMGPASLLSKEASRADRELAARVILTYAKTEPQNRHTLQIGEESIETCGLSSKNETAKYLILAA